MWMVVLHWKGLDVSGTKLDGETRLTRIYRHRGDGDSVSRKIVSLEIPETSGEITVHCTAFAQDEEGFRVSQSTGVSSSYSF